MKQPYTYSMPESFLKDKSVPARWRVLGVINGFILNGGCFYGSNEWLMEQLGCSQQTISTAFAELEELKEIRTERTKRSRLVYKTSRDTNQLVSEIQTDSSRDPSQLVPNSVSNSVKEYSAVAIAPRVIAQEPRFSGEYEIEEIGARTKKEKDANLDRSVKYWRELCKRETDLLPSTGIPTIKKILKNAHTHLTWPQIKQKMDEWFDVDGLQDHEKIQITRCFSTVQIDAFKAENV